MEKTDKLNTLVNGLAKALADADVGSSLALAALAKVTAAVVDIHVSAIIRNNDLTEGHRDVYREDSMMDFCHDMEYFFSERDNNGK